MTEHSYPLELLRAELKSAMAEQLVQLVDRFASKQDLAAFKSEQVLTQKENEARFVAIDHKLDLLLAEKNQRDGATVERKGWLDSRRFIVSTIVALVVGLVGAVATLVWLAVG